jgi:hypothetical protein
VVSASQPKTLRLQQRFNWRAVCASAGLGSPLFTKNMCGQKKILARFDLTKTTSSFSTKVWAGYLSGRLTDRHNLLAWVSGQVYLNFSRKHLHDFWKICHSVRGFITTVLHHVTVIQCVNICCKMTPEARFVADEKLRFPGLHAHTCLFFLWGYLNLKFYASIVDIRRDTMA